MIPYMQPYHPALLIQLPILRGNERRSHSRSESLPHHCIRLIKNLPRIQQPLRIQRLFHRAHQGIAPLPHLATEEGQTLAIATVAYAVSRWRPLVAAAPPTSPEAASSPAAQPAPIALVSIFGNMVSGRQWQGKPVA